MATDGKGSPIGGKREAEKVFFIRGWGLERDAHQGAALLPGEKSGGRAWRPFRWNVACGDSRLQAMIDGNKDTAGKTTNF